MKTIAVPHGHIADVITHLEMTEKPGFDDIGSKLTITAWEKPEPAAYLKLFRQVGEPWLWLSRLLLSEDELTETIHHEGLAIYRVQHDDSDAGFIELDFRETGECEIGFFGLLKEMNGQGHGRWLMNETLKLAWRGGIERVWLHTCTLDSPFALGFYLKSGFTAYKREVSMNIDPRITGQLPKDAGPHIPLIS